ncbi:20S proteasome subunit A/B [Cyanobium sp. NIES-981]|uniref:20S proteasome subunit A/B n=1 Tax=Cyanobium sp. NIES-981 TaxID=1851505 RepID=UPI0007DD4AD0|nr:20S proteasome subunit A/B [Cyanobium sp. NIES-981]SBO44866.1 20S proteasome, A/B subunit [Cyanobium sp. NIES-981]
MTYCVAFLLDAGLVFASDSRTNAGVDYISTYSKMHVFQPAPDRLFVLLAAGNLATTQAVLNQIQRDLRRHGVGPMGNAVPGMPVGSGPGISGEAGDPPLQTSVFVGLSDPAPAAVTVAPEAGQPMGTSTPPCRPPAAIPPPEEDGEPANLVTARYLFEAADYVGRMSVAVQDQHKASLHQSGASAEASFILGGQIEGDRHGLYLIYPQGNAVMATRETPFLQIGESKYGKPPLDFVGHCGLSLEDAARLCLISQVITRRSNLSVGPPFELALMPANGLKITRRIKLAKGAPEIGRSMQVWAACMQEGLRRLPRFAWEEDPL